MAYNTKQIVKDKDGNPISQYYNSVADQYEPVEGAKGGNKVVVENNDLSLIPILDKLSQLTGTVIDEETRKSNEVSRKSAETTRVSTETARKSAETGRVTAETDRVTKENDRVTKETDRVAKEKVRVTSETTRVNAEDARKANETNRVNSEDIRKSNELLRIQLYELITQKLNDGEFKGDKGDTGNGLEYTWRGTELGVRVAGQTNYVYVNLKGEKGDTGSIENLTKKHVTDALGYTPPEIANNLTETVAGKALDATQGKILKDAVDEHKSDNTYHVRYGIATGANAKVIALSPVPSEYVDGMALSFKNISTNTGAVTLNVNDLGAKSIKNSKGDLLEGDALVANSIYTVRYNGVNFILQGEGGGFPDGWNEVVEGRASENIAKSDAILYGQKTGWDIGVVKLNNPNVLPPVNGSEVSFSPNGDYLAVGHLRSPYITIYKRNGDTFTKLSDPISLPSGSNYTNAKVVEFSDNGEYLVVGTSGIGAVSPYLYIYKRNGDIFTLLENVATSSLEIEALSFSPNGDYLAVGHNSSPYITIYKRNGDTFTKLPNPNVLPTGNVNGVDFSSDGNYVGLITNNNYTITVYKRNGDTFTNLPAPNNGFPSVAYGISFSPNGDYLAVGHNSSPYITIYKRNGDTFTKLPNPNVLPTGNGRAVSFNYDSNYLAVGHNSSPYITIYKRNGDTFTKLPNPNVLPTGNVNGVDFSTGKEYMSLATDSSPYISVYKSKTDEELTIEKLQNRTVLSHKMLNGYKLGVASGVIQQGQVGKISLFAKIYNLPE